MIELPRSVQRFDGPGRLPFLRIEGPHGSAELCLQGAHLTSWTPHDHEPVLWMSADSRFAPGLPIRGGIPICFPWFNRLDSRPEAPQHGFARILTWSLTEAREVGDAVEVTLRLADSATTRGSAWPFRFELSYTVTVGRTLGLELEVVNLDAGEIRFEEALHTYLAVGDIRAARIAGLEGLGFSAEGERSTAEGHPVAVGAAGVSRRYPEATGGIVEDGDFSRTITISSGGSRGVVLWNPGAAGAQTMEDFADDGWPNMLCLETCNIGEAGIRLGPGESHRMRATFAVAPLAA
ncbi:MAG: D-hexose-6-phosphate mutarotase [Cryobacterium sp.]|nr:D-hexose-6-phosphate mutarotase [Cryobacterium sp.]